MKSLRSFVARDDDLITSQQLFANSIFQASSKRLVSNNLKNEVFLCVRLQSSAVLTFLFYYVSDRSNEITRVKEHRAGMRKAVETRTTARTQEMVLLTVRDSPPLLPKKS